MRNDRLTRIGLFSLYFLCVIVGEAGLLASICFHYESGWFTFDTALAVVFLVFAVALFFMLWGRACKRDQTLFVLVAAPLLVGFALFMMPFAVPDEFTHINRIFDNRSTCPLTTPAQMLDAYTWISSYDVLAGFLAMDFDYSLTKETEFCAASYSEINYLPPALVVAVGKLFGINGYVLVFAARLSNAALYLIACYWMIGKLPFGRKLAFVFLLNPMLLQQEASCSADALCNIAILGFFVQLVAMRFGRNANPSKREWVTLLAFGVLVGVCKYVYLPLLLSAVILYPMIKSKAVKRILPLAVLVLMGAAVAFVVFRGYGDSLERLLSLFRVDTFFGSLGATVVEEGMTMAWQFAGGNLGWPYMNHADAFATIRIPLCWVVFLAMLAVATMSSSSEKATFERWERIFLLVLVVFECLLIFAALWQGVEGAVTWLQGRYFIPPVFLLLFAVLIARKTTWSRIPLRAFAIGMLAVNAISLMLVIRWLW